MMQDTRLDLDAPLLSVRRHSGQPAGNPSEKPASWKPLTPSWRPALPFYNSELKSGPVRNPGVVPFVWEQEPGQPKASPADGQLPAPVGPVPIFPPGRTLIDRDPNGHKRTETPPASEVSLKEEGEDEEDNSSNAVETLSCNEFFLMNCSVSGIPDAVEDLGTISIDPQARTSMMERFLPAAQAMASSSMQCPLRKPSKAGNRFENGGRQLGRSPLPYQHMPNFVARYPRDGIYGVDGDDEDCDENCEVDGDFTSKGCGLLPRLCQKSSFCLLNPISGMKVGCRRPLPLATGRKIRSTMNCKAPLSQAEDELWKLMYKHKQSVGIPHDEEGGGSRNTNKSNDCSLWSDSQTLDEFSPCRSNRETLVEILKRDMKNVNNDGSESFDKNGERFWAMNSSHGNQNESSVLSPAMAKDTHMDSGVLFEIPDSLASSTGREIVFNQRMEVNPAIKGCNGIEHVNSNEIVKRKGQSKNNLSSLHSLLPLPFPNTPSESWLSRTLPSVSSSKIPSGQSIFGVHVPQRKVAFHSSSTDLRQESDASPLESSKILDVKISKTPRRQICFADVLMTPLSPRSEM